MRIEGELNCEHYISYVTALPGQLAQASYCQGSIPISGRSAPLPVRAHSCGIDWASVLLPVHAKTNKTLRRMLVRVARGVLRSSAARPASRSGLEVSSVLRGVDVVARGARPAQQGERNECD